MKAWQCIGPWLLCLLAGPALAAQMTLPAGATVRIEQAEFVLSDDPLPPVEGWQAQALPDSWRLSRPGRSGYGWYRVRLQVPAEQDLPKGSLGLMISLVGTTYAVYANGVDLGEGGGMTGEIKRNGGVPQFVLIPPQVLEVGDNWLYVRLRVAGNLRGGLTPLLLGPREAVENEYDRVYFWRVTLSRSANVALIVTGLLVGLLWLRQRERSVYGYFAALAVLWSLRNFHYTYTGSGIPSRLWEAFILGSLGVVLLLVCLFMLRLTDQTMPRTERAMKLLCLATPLAFFVIGEQAMSQVRLAWYGLCALLGVGAIGILVRHLGTDASARRKPGLWAILGAMMVTLAFGLHDYAVSANLLPYGSAVMMAFGAPLLLAALVFTLAGEYFGAIAAAARLNNTLEQRIEQRSAELVRTHERLRQLERDTAVAQERERLMRDIHDGVGSQLITAMTGIERGRLSQDEAAGLIAQCIDDLRLVIDSLDPEQRHAGDALAMLRYRMQPKFEAAGLQPHWTIGPQAVAMAPGELLHLVRIVQEALTNVLKHAGATRVWVSFAATGADGWCLEVRDDGPGPIAQAPRAAGGRGLGNMARRASQLAARWESGPVGQEPGYRVRVQRDPA
ncbi:MAG: hypothetical protein KIS62_02080 [Ramlibacter sp.]|nr:hypothetical protein [Ramlibacter sp.]